MAHHVHCHIHYGEKTADRPTFGSEHETDDAGTSEGARKAAQTRAAHGGAGHQQYTSGQHLAAAEEHSKKADEHRMKSGSNRLTSEHSSAKWAHLEAMQAHRKAAKDPRQSSVAHIRTEHANHLSSRLTADRPTFGSERETDDAGTSEGARKAALTRKNKAGTWKVRLHNDPQGRGMFTHHHVEASSREEAQQKAAQVSRGTDYPHVGHAVRVK